MKKILMLVALSIALIGQLSATCTKSTHVKARTINGVVTKHYTCTVKSRPYYEALDNPTTVNIFYTNNVCKICGCTSSCHNDK